MSDKEYESFHQELHTWCFGLGLYIITIESMLLSRYDPLMPKTEEKLGLSTISWSNEAKSAALPRLHHEDELVYHLQCGTDEFPLILSLIQRKIYGNEYCITCILWYRKYLAHPNHIIKNPLSDYYSMVSFILFGCSN